MMSEQYVNRHEASAQYQRNAESDRHATSYEVAEACQGRAGNAFRACIAEHLETYYRDQATNEDLQAQQDMAYWAGALFFSSTILTGIGIFLLYGTLAATRETLREAERGADAAQEMLAIERKPFLSIRPLDANKIQWDKEAGKISIENSGGGDPSESVFCEIKNSGRSSAILTAVYRKWIAIDRHNPIVIDPSVEGDSQRLNVTIPISADGIVMAAKSEGEIHGKPDEWLMFVGYLEFTDVEQSDTYVSGFAFVYDPEGMPGRGLIVAPFAGGKHWYHRKK
ncbi:MAG: hypothetical protein IH582_16890 [Afipia sp.]|nr:hypothetical protein [Afipia sp.]